MTYIIVSPCVDLKDASCVDVCPVDCIYEGETMYYINPDECIDCAACEPVCPVAAIFAEDAVPENEKEYIPLNYNFPYPS
jgi:NAD-dependent dihydropyrimidine dehydrogenase PreA subunit